MKLLALAPLLLLSAAPAKVSQPDPTPSGFGAKIEELNKADDGPDLDYFAALANDD